MAYCSVFLFLDFKQDRYQEVTNSYILYTTNNENRLNLGTIASYRPNTVSYMDKMCHFLLFAV